MFLSVSFCIFYHNTTAIRLLPADGWREGGSMSKRLSIERAGYGDVPAIRKIMVDSYRLVRDSGWYVIDDTSFLERHIEEEGITLKAVTEDTLAGFLVIRYPGNSEDNLGSYIKLTQEQGMAVAHMESAAVVPHFRGRGIQKQLMDSGEKLLAGTAYTYLMGTAHPDNIYSVNNFLKLGYDIVAEEEKYGGLPRYVFCKVI